MKEIALPATRERQRKKCASLRRTGRFLSVGIVLCAVFAILLILGLFITVIVFEFKGFADGTLFYSLLGSFAGGGILLALAAFGLNVLARRHRQSELDFRERCDGEASFFVGDGTLATFEETGVCIHGENAADPQKEIRVPYSAMRFFSVCTRRAPREEGEWSVVLEIPARYLAKEGRAKADERPALVQTDAKPRLFRTLEERGLALIGERQSGGNAKFSPRAKFFLPNKKKRRSALLTLCVCGALIVAGVFVGVFWQVVAGALLGAVGLVWAGRAFFSFTRAKGMLGVYEEGLYWRESNRVDSVFLKWGEIERIARETAEGFEFYRVQCAYGAYHFPVAGSFAYLKEAHPEKFGEEA